MAATEMPMQPLPPFVARQRNYLAQELACSADIPRRYARRQTTAVSVVIVVLALVAALFFVLWVTGGDPRPPPSADDRRPVLPDCGDQQREAVRRAFVAAYSQRRSRLRVPADSAAWRLQTSDMAYATALDWLVDETRRTGAYHERPMAYAVETADPGYWRATSIDVPFALAMCALLTGLRRNAAVERQLVALVRQSPDPFVRGGAPPTPGGDNTVDSTPELYGDLYRKLAYQLVLRAYEVANGVKLYTPPASVAAAIEAWLVEPQPLLRLGDTAGGRELAHGFYVAPYGDAAEAARYPNDEVGFVGVGGVAGGLEQTSYMAAPLWAIETACRVLRDSGQLTAVVEANKARGDSDGDQTTTTFAVFVPRVRELSALVFRRLYNATARYPYAQLRGGGRAIARLRFRAQQLAALYHLGQLDPRNYTVGVQRMVDQLCALTPGQTQYAVVTADTIPCVTTGSGGGDGGGGGGDGDSGDGDGSYATNRAGPTLSDGPGGDDGDDGVSAQQLATTPFLLATPYNDEYVARSRAEGFVLATRGAFAYEQACTAAYLRPTDTGSDADDDLEHNAAYTAGYVNFGCDYAPVFRDLNGAELTVDQLPNDNFTRGFALAGQIYREQALVPPDACSFVPVNNDGLYYTSHYANAEVRVSGLLDLDNRVHRFYVRSTDDRRTIFCPFAWTSDNRILLSVAGDRYPNVEAKANSTLVVTDRVMAATITAEYVVAAAANGAGASSQADAPTTPRLVANVDSLGGPAYFCSVTIRLPTNVTLMITVYMDLVASDETSHASRLAARIAKRDVHFGLDDDLTVEPANAATSAASRLTTVQNPLFNRRLVVDDSLLTGPSVSAATVRRKDGSGVAYKFSSRELQRYATVPS